MGAGYHPMPVIKVDFYGIYRQIAGGKTIEFNLSSGGTLLDLLNVAAAQFPPLRNEIFDGRGNLFASIPLFLNGRNPRLLQDGVFTIIQPGDVLSIFSPIASGAINVENVNQTLSDA